MMIWFEGWEKITFFFWFIFVFFFYYYEIFLSYLFIYRKITGTEFQKKKIEKLSIYNYNTQTYITKSCTKANEGENKIPSV